MEDLIIYKNCFEKYTHTNTHSHFYSHLPFFPRVWLKRQGHVLPLQGPSCGLPEVSLSSFPIIPPGCPWALKGPNAFLKAVSLGRFPVGGSELVSAPPSSSLETESWTNSSITSPLLACKNPFLSSNYLGWRAVSSFLFIWFCFFSRHSLEIPNKGRKRVTSLKNGELKKNWYVFKRRIWSDFSCFLQEKLGIIGDFSS